MKKVILGLILVFSINCGCSKKDTPYEKWNERVKKAYKDLCNRNIEPEVTKVVNSDYGVWVYFKFENVLRKNNTSTLKFMKGNDEWVLAPIGVADKDTICKQLSN